MLLTAIADERSFYNTSDLWEKHKKCPIRQKTDFIADGMGLRPSRSYRVEPQAGELSDDACKVYRQTYKSPWHYYKEISKKTIALIFPNNAEGRNNVQTLTDAYRKQERSLIKNYVQDVIMANVKDTSQSTLNTETQYVAKFMANGSVAVTKEDTDNYAKAVEQCKSEAVPSYMLGDYALQYRETSGIIIQNFIKTKANASMVSHKKLVYPSQKGPTSVVTFNYLNCLYNNMGS